MVFFDPAFEARRSKVIGGQTAPQANNNSKPTSGGFVDPVFEARRAQIISAPVSKVSTTPVKTTQTKVSPSTEKEYKIIGPKSPVDIAQYKIGNFISDIGNAVHNITKNITFTLKPPSVSSPINQNNIPNAINSAKPVVKAQPGVVNQLQGAFPQTSAAVSSVIKDPLGKKVLEDKKKDPYAAVNDMWNAIKDPFIKLMKRSDTYYSKPNQSFSEKASNDVKRYTAAVNVLFSPINAVFAGAEHVPVINTLAKIISIPLTAVDEFTPKVTDGLIDKLPIDQKAKDQWKPAIAEVGTLVGQIALGKLGDVVGKKAGVTVKKIGADNFERLTKNVIEETGAAKTVKLTPSDIKQINLGKTGYEADLVKSLGLSGSEWKKAVQSGISIDIPAEKLIRIVDKPYWEKVKSVFNVEATDITKTVGGDPSATSGFMGYLGDGEHTPQQIIDAVVKSSDKTVEAQSAMRVAIEAQNKGLNIDISKLLEAPKSKGLLEAPKPSNIGDNFVMSDKVDKNKLEVMKSINEYRTAVEKYNKNPTPTSLKRFQKTRETMNTLLGKGLVKPATKELNIANKVLAPNEALDLVFKNKIENTPTGNEIVKNVLQAREQNKSIIIESSDTKPVEINLVDPNTRIEETKVPKLTETPVVEPKKQPSKEETDKILSETPVESKKTVEVPRDQLPVGKGKEKASRLEARMVEALAKVSPETIDKIGTTTYNEMNKKENIKLASEYVVDNPEKSLKVLKGDLEAPSGIARNAIYVAMQNLALGDVTLARKLASLESTRLGQELSILTEINKDSPVSIAHEIVKIREESVKNKYKDVKTAKEKVKKSAEEKVKKPDKYDWSDFVKSLEC